MPELQTGAVDQRDRDPGAVFGVRPVPALDVVLRAVVTEYLLLAQQDPFAGRHRRCRRCGASGSMNEVAPIRQAWRFPVRVAGHATGHQFGVEADLFLGLVSAGDRGYTSMVGNPRAGSGRRSAPAKASTPSRRTSSRAGIRVVRLVGSSTGASTRAVHRAVVMQDQERSSPSMTACSTVRSTTACGAAERRRNPGRRIGGRGEPDLRGDRRTGDDDDIGV